jgi:hypothetical protein
LVRALTGVTWVTSDNVSAKSILVTSVGTICALINVNTGIVNASSLKTSITVTAGTGPFDIIYAMFVSIADHSSAFAVVIHYTIIIFSTVAFSTDTLITVITTSYSDQIAAF